MATARPFAYNPTHIEISGTTLYGDISVGDADYDYSTKPGGLDWWNGADEDSGFVICMPVSGGDHPTPIGDVGTVKFFRSAQKNEDSLLGLVNVLSNGSVTNSSEMETWFNTNGYWSEWRDYFYPFAFTGGTSSYRSVDNHGMTFEATSEATLVSFKLIASHTGTTTFTMYKYNAEFTYTPESTGTTWYFEGQQPYLGTEILIDTWDIVVGDNNFNLNIPVSGTTETPSYYYMGFSSIEVGPTDDDGLYRTYDTPEKPWTSINGIRLMDSRSRLSNFDYDRQVPAYGPIYYYFFNVAFSKGINTTTTTTTTGAATTTTTTTGGLEIHNLNLGTANNNWGDIATWQNVGRDYDAAPMTLLDQNGDDKGLKWQVPENTVSMNIRKQTLNSGITSGDSDFPDDVLLLGMDSYGAFVSLTKNAVIRISGCTNDTYTFKIYCSVNVAVTGWAVSDTNYTGLKLVGGGTDDTTYLDPINNSTVITLSNTPNSDAYIDLEFYGDEDWDHPVINAIIISK